MNKKIGKIKARAIDAREKLSYANADDQGTLLADFQKVFRPDGLLE